MSKKDIFGDEVKSKETDFASLFEESIGQAGKRFKVGDQFRAEILSIGQEEAFVSTGGSQDAVILRADLLDDEKNLKYKVGDILDVVVVKLKGGEIRVTRKGSKKAATDLDSLQDAFDMELPVEGRVLELVKGGFRVDMQGQKAFCPISQIDAQFVQSGEEYVGKKFEFIITQLDESGRNIVVSRKKLLQLQRAESEGAWMEKHKVGDVMPGTVSRLEAFGAFVKFNDGVEGLVHVSEIGFTRLKHASEALKVGELVQVKILKIEDDGGRLKISLSIKQAGGIGDPWMKVPVEFPVGSVLMGTVEKKENFGLFVQLAPGITGLLPKSKWRDSVEGAQFENKKRGDQVQVRVDQIQFEERRLTLGLPSEDEDLSWKNHQTSSKSFGAFADAFKNATTARKK
jgi:small subunit ribosomal protein S1